MSLFFEGSLEAFLFAFCRVSGFIMLLPGFASLRIPMQVRLYIAIFVAAALAPNLAQLANVNLLPANIIAEVTIGAVLGILVRLHFLALNFAAVTIASYIGLAAMPGVPVESDEAQAALSSLITLTATALIFISGLHGQLLLAVGVSYSVLEPGAWLDVDALVQSFLQTLQQTFLLALQLTMPFLAYGVLINIGLGLANKMSPQVPVYFISLPYVIAGGLVLLYLLAPEMLALFMEVFSASVLKGWY